LNAILSPIPDLQQISAEMLGVAEEVLPDSARSEFLRRLERIEFVPPETWCAALKQLDDRPSTYPDGSDTPSVQQCKRIRQVLRKFCSSFWELETRERSAQFRHLRKHGKDDEFVQTQLDRIEPGLNVDAHEFSRLDGVHSAIARIIRDSFAEFPVERAAIRNAFLAKLRKNLTSRSIVSCFREQAPSIARLDRYVLRRIECECLERNPSAIERIMRFTGLNLTARDGLWFAVGMAIILVFVLIAGRTK
jgi:hypothetical protein